MKNWLIALAICGIATVYAAEEKTEETTQVVETTEEAVLSAATNETEETAVNEEGEKCVLHLCAADEVIAAEESEKEGERKLEAWPRPVLG